MTKFLVESLFDEGGFWSEQLPRESVQEVLDTITMDIKDGAVAIQIFIRADEDGE